LSARGAHRASAHPRAARRRFAPLLTLVVLTGCSTAALPRQDLREPEPQANYLALISNYLRTQLKDVTSYDSFELSNPRWVHAATGWSVMSCVRFNDRGHTRSYAMFIQQNAVADARYAVQTDSCSSMTYTPFDPNSGTIGRSPMGLSPLH